MRIDIGGALRPARGALFAHARREVLEWRKWGGMLKNYHRFRSVIFGMFWADRIAEDISRKYAGKMREGKPLVIRDEKTGSGHVHVGAARTVAVHGILAEILGERATFLYEINNFDAFDSLLPYLDHETYRPHLGKPLFAVPSPRKGFSNFAEYFGKEFIGVIEGLGFKPSFYYSYDKYKEGKYDEAIDIALRGDELIRGIYRRVSGSDKKESWLPIMMICERCGKIATTRALSYDGREVAYVCEQKETGSGAFGCGYEGKNSPFGGRAKLPWKVEWGAKFKVFDVDVEGEGKDLATKGGARDVANHISREVFRREPPFDVPHEFFLVKGKKMSTSRGNAATAKEIYDLIPSQIFRLALLGKDYKQAVNFEPDGETIPILYDQYDKLAEGHWSGIKDHFSRLFELIHPESHKALLAKRYLPRFSTVSFIVQMPHLNLEEEIARMKGSELTTEDRRELEERAAYARRWLAEHAPEKYVYELKKETVPEAAKTFSSIQKTALRALLKYLTANGGVTGEEIHAKLHEIKTQASIPPADFFKAIYLAFLGKESGPKAGWFLSVLDRNFLLRRLHEVSA